MSTKTLKVGIIGAGTVAPAHVEAYKQIPWVELIGVADINETRAKDAAKKWGLPEDRAFTDYHQLLDLHPDAVSVCTWHKAHAPVTIDALNAGVNVLVEKPMATTGEEAYSMYKAAQKNGKVLMVGFQSRYNPELIAAKKFVDTGFLGKPYFAEATGIQNEGDRRRGIPGGNFIKADTAAGGVNLDIGVYSIDNLLYLLDSPNPLSVTAISVDYLGHDESASKVVGAWGWNPKELQVEEFSAALIRFEDDLVMTYKRAWAMHAETLGTPFLLGTKGGLSFNPLTLYTDMNGYMVNINPVHLPSGRVQGEQEPWFFKRGVDFVTAVRDGTNPPIDTKGIVKLHYVIDGIYESSRVGHEVKLNLPADLTQ
ncbi:MAG: Gfo/Idh/MocA family protein [Thermoprotei archaeon]